MISLVFVKRREGERELGLASAAFTREHMENYVKILQNIISAHLGKKPGFTTQNIY